MERFFSYLRHHYDVIFRGVLSVLSVLLIVFVFPKDVQFKYDFSKGKPWKHSDLFAPFDFPIYMSAEEKAEAEKTVIDRNKPFFYRAHGVFSEQLKSFDDKFEKQWSESDIAQEQKKMFGMFDGRSQEEIEKLKQAHYGLGRRLINEIYSKGILEVADVIEDKPEDFEITITNRDSKTNNTYASDKEISEFFTLRGAHSHVRQAILERSDIDHDLMISLLESVLTHNILFDQETTKKFLNDKLGNIVETRGMVSKDEKIIEKGDIVTEEVYQKLLSLKREYEEQIGESSNSFLIAGGQIILVGLAMTVLLVFLTLFRKDVVKENKQVLFILLLFTLIVYMGAIPLKFQTVNIYVLPFCLLPVILRTFYDVRLATFVHTITIVVIGFLAPNSFEFLFIQLITGSIAGFSLVGLRRRSQLLRTVLVIFAVYSLTYLGFAVIQEGDLETIDWMYFAWFGGSALLTSFAFPLIYVFEKLFGFLSDVTLLELADTNNPLLRELAAKTPGTFQHTMQVANLAEEAVLQVGGDPLLVRTGALYHDIGKMADPMFFIENQVSGINPHDELAYDESAAIIIGHVINGIEMARKNNLPEKVIDFIRTHHGTTKTMYFLNSYKRDFPDEEVDETKFQYPGPVPYSKETAILMMADSVEAASRSLKKHDPETISTLIENIIDGQAAQGQFVNADITFKEITTIKRIFKKMVMNIYHVRIEYPK